VGGLAMGLRGFSGCCPAVVEETLGDQQNSSGSRKKGYY